MRFVALKSVAQQHVLEVHRGRRMAVRNRTAQANEIHGFLMEYGIESLKRGALLRELGDELRRLDARIAAIAAREPACQRLSAIPGIGVLTATALVAAVGDGAQFRNGREIAA